MTYQYLRSLTNRPNEPFKALVFSGLKGRCNSYNRGCRKLDYEESDDTKRYGFMCFNTIIVYSFKRSIDRSFYFAIWILGLTKMSQTSQFHSQEKGSKIAHNTGYRVKSCFVRNFFLRGGDVVAPTRSMFLGNCRYA